MFFLQKADFLLITLGTARAARVWGLEVLGLKASDLTRQCVPQDALVWHL